MLYCCSAWLKYNNHPILTGIKRRTEDASGLTLDTAEELQVANYGIGGHYEPHFDFARVSFSLHLLMVHNRNYSPVIVIIISMHP